MGNFVTAGALTALISLIFFIIRLVAFVITAAGLYRIARKRNLANPWLAWIPVVRYYQLGLMINQVLAITPQLRIPFIQFILPLSAAFMLLGSGSVLGVMFAITTYILAVLVFCALFRQYREEPAVLFGIMAGVPYLEIIGCFMVYRLGDLPTPEADRDTTVFP